MKACILVATAIVAVTVPGASVLLASRQTPTTTTGRQLYATHCATCHGPAGRGDGPLAEFLRVPPSDLAAIAARNKGAFPAAVIERIVDGRQALKLHGSAMPVWGDAFSPPGRPDADPAVAAKIRAIVAYLESIQDRPGE
jgi:mono/diheme cytochrome c family protein